MASEASSGLWYQLLVRHQEVVSRSRQLLGGRDAFSTVSVRLPNATHAELAFYQSVTWIYALYVESGIVSFSFLIPRLEAYGLDEDGENKCHFSDIRSLRTFLQHNLSFDSARENRLQERCSQWFVQHCGSVFPGDEQEWECALSGVLETSCGFLSSMNACLRMLEQDAASEMVVQQWIVRLDRHHTIHEFRAIVEAVIHDVGQPWLDAGRITKSQYSIWSSKIRTLSVGYDFEHEARRIVEHTIVNEYDPPLPITGSDLMREFGLPPGREVGEMLRRARSIYSRRPRDRDQLMDALRKYVIGDM